VLLVQPRLWRRLFAEYLGSLLLAAIVIGSGIAAQSLSPHAVGLELFENAAATGVGLYVIILTFGAVSGAHFNPIISFVDAMFGGISWSDAWCYLAAQLVGCSSGAVLANVMFSRSAIALSTDHRATLAHGVSEIVATAGLVLVIFALAKTGRSSLAPAAVGAYIDCAYFFTSSTSFANPAIVVGRMFTNTFAGIAPASTPLFVGAEVIGGLLGYLLVRALYVDITYREAENVTVAHGAAERREAQ
jgi:arsenate reductase